jgi:dipeptidyl aminopeptidase/acylaminoacyl peptidase
MVPGMSRLIVLLFFLVVNHPLHAQNAERTVTFKGRTIDLAPYVEGFPYYGFAPVLETGEMFYYERGESDRLKRVNLGEATNLGRGDVISDIDFSARNVWGLRYHAGDGQLYYSGDARNDEIINIWRLDPQTGHAETLTDVPYVFGWRWDEARERIAYVVRLADKEERQGDVRILDLTTGNERILAQDVGSMRFTWGSPSWRPGNQGIVFSANQDADRTYGNLVYLPLHPAPGTVETLLETDVPRNVSVLEKWPDEDTFLYLSNEGGYTNLYRYDLTSRESERLTVFRDDIRSIQLLESEAGLRAVVVLQRAAENELIYLDTVSGMILDRMTVDSNVSITDEHNGEMVLYSTSARTPFEMSRLRIRNGFHVEPMFGLPESLERQISHCEVERLEYPTFDTDPATGQPRILHAFLYSPQNPLPENERLALITSFYGGGNSFSNQVQILCEAGIFVMSPSPRGSSGFGQEFAALNDADLGGNEIIDIIYAGRWLSDRLGIPPSRIGPYGGSHGGYATMRLLTFPGEINDYETSFDWGFGISHAGFSDIYRFWELSNIPDWVTLEAGDPHTERAKLDDRSPINHAHRLTGPLLLTHGSNDSRVPVVESRTMYEALREAGMPVVYHEFEGQGHGIRGLENTVRNYRAWFEFLESIE